MNIGEIPKKNKKSVFEYVFKGMWKMGFNSMFKTEHEDQVHNLRKNSKSERIILTSEEVLYNSEETSKTSEESEEDQKDFSRELEKLLVFLN